MRWRHLLLLVGLTVSVSVAAPSVASAEASCTTTFVAASGSWSTASNWSGGGVPLATSRPCVPAGSGVTVSGADATVLSVDGAGSVLLSGASLRLMDSATPSSVRTVVIDGGGLFGPGELHVRDALTWSRGAVNGGATLVVDAGASGSVGATGVGVPNLSGRLVNDGSLTLVGNVQNFESGAVFDNRGTFHANGAATMYPYGSVAPAQRA